MKCFIEFLSLRRFMALSGFDDNKNKSASVIFVEIG